MDIREVSEVYVSVCGGSNVIESISIAEKTGAKKKIDSLIELGFSKDEVISICSVVDLASEPREDKRGRKAEVIENPLAEQFILNALERRDDGSVNDDGVVGVCRSFQENEGQKRTSVSPSNLKKVMTQFEISKESIKQSLGVGDRHAYRYMQAAKILINTFKGK